MLLWHRLLRFHLLKQITWPGLTRGCKRSQGKEWGNINNYAVPAYYVSVSWEDFCKLWGKLLEGNDLEDLVSLNCKFPQRSFVHNFVDVAFSKFKYIQNVLKDFSFKENKTHLLRRWRILMKCKYFLQWVL